MNVFTSADAATQRRDFLLSLAALGLLVVVVLGGLAHDENWRKLLRVLIAASTYLSLLLLFFNRTGRAGFNRKGRASGRPPLWAFALAAGLAELASGWLRPNTEPTLTFWVAPAAALLVGGIHWLALSSWRAVRRSVITSLTVF